MLIGRVPPAIADIAFERSAAQPPAAGGASLERAQVGRGAIVIAADLFGQGEATADGLPLRENPRVQYPGATDKEADRWRLDPSYAYGYNPAVFARRVHDLLALVAFARSPVGPGGARVMLVGDAGAGHWVAATLAALRPWTADRPAVDRAVIITAGFRFAELDNAWHPDFLPGGAKYGDVPALLALSLPTRLVVHDPDAAAGRMLTAWAAAAGCPDAVTILPSADLGAALAGE